MREPATGGKLCGLKRAGKELCWEQEAWLDAWLDFVDGLKYLACKLIVVWVVVDKLARLQARAALHAKDLLDGAHAAPIDIPVLIEGGRLLPAAPLEVADYDVLVDVRAPSYGHSEGRARKSAGPAAALLCLAAKCCVAVLDCTLQWAPG